MQKDVKSVNTFNWHLINAKCKSIGIPAMHGIHFYIISTKAKIEKLHLIVFYSNYFIGSNDGKRREYWIVNTYKKKLNLRCYPRIPSIRHGLSQKSVCKETYFRSLSYQNIRSSKQARTGHQEHLEYSRWVGHKMGKSPMTTNR